MKAINIIGYSDELRPIIAVEINKILVKDGVKSGVYPRITHNLSEMKKDELETVVTHESHMIYWAEGVDVIHPEDRDSLNILLIEKDKSKKGYLSFENSISKNMKEADIPFITLKVNDKNDFKKEVVLNEIKALL